MEVIEAKVEKKDEVVEEKKATLKFTCTQCKTEKDFDEFYKRFTDKAKTKSNYDKLCKKCRSASIMAKREPKGSGFEKLNKNVRNKIKRLLKKGISLSRISIESKVPLATLNVWKKKGQLDLE